jgi:hypothetical protein
MATSGHHFLQFNQLVFSSFHLKSKHTNLFNIVTTQHGAKKSPVTVLKKYDEGQRQTIIYIQTPNMYHVERGREFVNAEKGIIQRP